MQVHGERFLSVADARLVRADDPEYRSHCEAMATATRTRFTRSSQEDQQIVSTAAERAFRIVVERLSGSAQPRILRADVVYPRKAKPEPFFLELDAVAQLPAGLTIMEVKTGRLKLRSSARKQLERVSKLATPFIGKINLVSVVVLPLKRNVDDGLPGWPRIRIGDLLAESFPQQSTLYVDADDLSPAFHEHERAALARYRLAEEIRAKADDLEFSGDAAGAKALRETLRREPPPEGTLTVDEDGIRVQGTEAAPWLLRKLQ